MKKETNNKGFSLVELIVVIAIMAVLVGVLAPSLLRYVEKARLQRDNSAISEIAEAMKIALADEDIYKAVSSSSGESFSIASGSVTFSSTSLQSELANTLGATVKLSSGKYTGTNVVMTATIEENGNVKITASSYYEDINADATTMTF